MNTFSDYHMVIVSGRQWRRVCHYVVPAIIFSILFNFPKFMELRTRYAIYERNDENVTVVSTTYNMYLYYINRVQILSTCSLFI